MSNKSTFAFERARSALISRDYNQAEKLLKRHLKENPNDIESLALLGTVYLRSDRQSDALPVYQKIAELDPRNVDAMNNLGVIYRRLDRFEESLAALNRALAADKDVSTVYYNLGNTYKEMGKYDEAADCFITVIDEKPDDVLAYNHLGVIQALRGQHTKAIQAYWKGLQIDPNHPILHFNIARSYEAQGKIDEALSSYEAALRGKPGWIEAMEAYADLLVRQNKKKEAEEVLTQALKIDDSHPHILTDLGRLYADKTLFDDAKSLFLRALQSDEKYLKALSNLEQLYEKLGDLDNALARMEQMDSFYPGTTDIENKYARLLMKMGRFDEAEGRLAEVLESEPDNLEALRMMGRYHSQNGNSQMARDYFNRIMELDPSDVGFRIDLADQMMNEGNYKGAEKQLREYLARRPDDKDGLLALAGVYEALREIEKALACYRNILNLEKDNQEILEAINRLCGGSGDNEAAVNMINDVINTQGSDADGDVFATINESLDEYEKALEQFEEQNTDILEKNLKKLKRRIQQEEKDAQSAADGGPNITPITEDDTLGDIDEEPDISDTELIDAFADSFPAEPTGDFETYISPMDDTELEYGGFESLARTGAPLDSFAEDEESLIIEELTGLDDDTVLPEEEEIVRLKEEPIAAPRSMPPLPRPRRQEQYNPVTEEPVPAYDEREAECPLPPAPERPASAYFPPRSSASRNLNPQPEQQPAESEDAQAADLPIDNAPIDELPEDEEVTELEVIDIIDTEEVIEAADEEEPEEAEEVVELTEEADRIESETEEIEQTPEKDTEETEQSEPETAEVAEESSADIEPGLTSAQEIAGLLRFLQGLSEDLPDAARGSFNAGAQRARLERLIEELRDVRDVRD